MMNTKRFLLVLATFTAFTLMGTDAACAQVEKTLQRTDANGQIVQTPYVTYEEFRSVTLHCPDGQVPLRVLLTVSSLDEVIRLLGDPQSVERNDDPDDASFTAWLHYGRDTIVEYHGFADGRLGLTSIELRSPKWGLEIGSKKLSPGIDIAGLDKKVRRSAVSGNLSKKKNKSGLGTIYIEKPNASKNGKVEPLMNGMTQFNFKTGETGTVEVVRISRIVPN
ncbi:hypothetical protein GGP91_002306 [Salinibacter ruber]|jgi:hypothetical protein|uniref:Secreted protein n=1 Tax=Salinibacter ruber TaxID=146919 RepID=A0A9X2V3A0_9BACT|nr:hypothetical protein [Salinibacter ruber]MCS3631711.1 hypothetical protein [Salinibacter ruber]MCS3633456.1 hypothetical protein [Salinibacter ruber]MCS3663973.1 hypothetical protein [Salinibacter ruber]MCS3684559.1 hypothetical protein [Salinibacter ruber]MCS3705474.1 hypothetical protein [Salinibacter ruber]